MIPINQKTIDKAMNNVIHSNADPLYFDRSAESGFENSGLVLKRAIAGYRAEILMLKREIKLLEEVSEAADGLSRGIDWNNGTHAKIFRPQLREALRQLFKKSRKKR